MTKTAPQLWLGTWSMGGQGFGPTDLGESRAVLETAFENGITHFDTANIYAKGQSETLENMESMIIKLIDRWNKSDETRDRRHEKMVEELNDQSSILMEIKGNLSRINGKH